MEATMTKLSKHMVLTAILLAAGVIGNTAAPTKAFAGSNNGINAPSGDNPLDTKRASIALTEANDGEGKQRMSMPQPTTKTGVHSKY
jgi:hypothetical protein